MLLYAVAILINGTNLHPVFAESLALGIPLPIPQGATLFAGFVALVVAGASRGLLRGQRPVYLLVVVVIALSAVAHMVRGTDSTSAVLALVVVGFLAVETDAFHARVSLREVGIRLSALIVLAVGLLGATLAASLLFEEARTHFGRPPLDVVLEGDYLTRPAKLLVALGLLLLATAMGWALTAPDERLPERGVDDAFTARELVRNFATDSLSYFALRDDKYHLVVDQGLVTYAVVDGFCLVAPDPLGPDAVQAWQALRTFAAAQGWPVAVVAAGEAEAQRLRNENLRVVYTGDEAVVDVRGFRLEGQDRKSLRQAVNRMRRCGYTTQVHRADELSDVDRERIHAIEGITRRGDVERGFSMTLGRIAAPKDDVVLTVVRNPGGTICAYCQFVPSRGFGWSLDVMRRDGESHPNGVMELALVDFFSWADQRGEKQVSLNFAPFRSVVDGTTQVRLAFGLDRWIVGRLGATSQITSLYRFNAKFDPVWQPRYAAVEAPEYLLPAALAWLRAEGLTGPSPVTRVAARLPFNRARRRGEGIPTDSAGIGAAGNGG